MATDAEKQELVDVLSGPRYYHIMISGYGGESAYVNISKEAHDFWKEVTEENGDNDLVMYAIAAEEWTTEQFLNGECEIEFDGITAADIPREALFLHTDEGEAGYPWYEAPGEFEHVWGVGSESARVYVEEVDSDEYNSKHIADVINGEDLNELINRVGDETEWEVELTDVGEVSGTAYPEKGSYVFQLYSSEKGTFFEGWIETVGDFDVKKFRVHIDEAPNGEDTVFGVYYDGKEIDNNGGDTNGKGYYASVWEQEF